MDDVFDMSMDTSVDTSGSMDIDTGSEIDLSESIEPMMDSAYDTGSFDVDESGMTELQNEADALEIPPLNEVADLGFDYDEAIQEANEAWATEAAEQAESSALSNIINAGADGAMSPSDLAQIGGETIAPPGAGEAVTQGLQAGWNMGVIGSGELMDAAQRQHGFSNPMEGVDYLINESGEPVQIGQMTQTTDEMGENIWIRSSDDTIGGQSDG
jgi:hypothetical protein